MKQLHPKSIWIFFTKYFTILFFITILFWLQASIYLFGQNNEVSGFLTIMVLVLPFLVFTFTYIWALLFYRSYKYELTNDTFRKEYGVIWKKYVSIPYERIQNINIHRGVMARLLGLSDLQIQTAGNSGNTGGFMNQVSAEGQLPGITKEEAEILRNELIQKSKQDLNKNV